MVGGEASLIGGDGNRDAFANDTIGKNDKYEEKVKGEKVGMIKSIREERL